MIGGELTKVVREDFSGVETGEILFIGNSCFCERLIFGEGMGNKESCGDGV
jgi:hypothetical protein